MTPSNRSERWLEDLRDTLTTAADPDRFGDPIWSQAARTRDFVAHHYQRIDLGSLWLTVSVSLPALADRLDA